MTPEDKIKVLQAVINDLIQKHNYLAGKVEEIISTVNLINAEMFKMSGSKPEKLDS